MRKLSTASALRISLIYVGVAGLWILLSGKMLRWLVSDPEIAANLEIYKGLAFVLVTATLLYFAIRRQLSRVEQELAERKRAEEALKLFRALIDRGNDGIEVIDPETGRFLDVNEKECQDLGYTREEMLGMTILDIDPTQTPESRAKTIARLQEHGSVTLEGVHRRKDGTAFPVELNLQFIRLDRDYVLTVARDITERNRAGESLALFHTLLNHSYDGIEVIDPATGRFLDVNATTCHELGYSREELLGMGVTDVEVSLTPAKLADVVATLRNAGSLTREAIHRRKDGTTFPVELNKRLVRLEREYIVTTARDISGRKQAELALRESQALYRSLVEQMSAGVFRKDAAGRYVFANSRFWQMTNTTPEDVLGKLPQEVTASRNTPQADSIQHHARIMETGQQIEVDEKHPDGKDGIRHVHAVKSPVRDASGKIVGSQGILFDVTKSKLAEVALRESEERLQAVVTRTRCILNFGTVEGLENWRERALDDQSCFRWEFPVLNEEAAQAVLPLQLAPGERYQQAWTRSRHTGDHIQMTRNSAGAFLWNAPFYRNEFRCTDKNWVEHWMQQFVTVRKLAENRWQIFGITTDISDLKRATEELRKNEAFLGSIVENIPNMLFVKDAQELRFVMFNKAGEELIGSPREELVGKNDADLFPPEQAAFFTAKDREVLQQGTVMEISEEKIQTRHNGERILHTKKIPVFDRAGRPQYLLGISEDITEFKRAEEAYKRLATAVDQAAESIIITDAQGTILYVNPAFEKLTGYTRQEVVGKNPRILKSGRHDTAYYKHIWETLANGNVWSGHLINKKKDGTLFELEASISPIRDADGRVINYVGVQRDVTREAALEAQLRQSQKMDAIGKLAGGVAHDFNNLLTVIRGNVALLQFQDSVSAEHAACLTEIVKATERAASLTRQLLMFSRQQELQTKDLDLNEVVGNVAKMLRRVLGEHIQMQLKFAPQPLFVHADPGMMDQILLNLAVNSRDAMPNGGQLSIETAFVELDEGTALESPQARPGAFACLSVTDNGCGIPPEVLPRIFDPFFTTKDIGKGTGLGLATVFGVVQQHQGWITVHSEVGGGTTFRVWLPLRQPSSAPATPAGEAAPTRGGWECILLVEDEAPVRMLVEKFLSRLGYRVFAAANGVNALEVWRQHKDEIQLLVTDLVLPAGINGRILAEQLRHEAPRLKVVYMSGYSPDMAEGNLPLREGVNFLVKPFAAHKLAQIVRAVLDA